MQPVGIDSLYQAVKHMVMNRIYSIGLIVLVLVVIVLPACKKDKSFESGEAPTGAHAWEFKQDVHAFKGPLDTAFFQNNGSVNSLVMEGTSTDQTGTFHLEIIGANIVAGVYATPSVILEYFSNGDLLYNNDPAATGKFTVTITSIDSAHVLGIFSGEVLDTTGAIVNMIDGKFSAAIRASDAAPPTNPSACRISNLANYDLLNGDKVGTVTTTFNGQDQVTKTEVIDSSSQTGGTITNTFNLVYSATQIKVDATQFFTLDGNGRISSFTGYFNPLDDSSPELVIKYTYNSNGYLTKATAVLKAIPFVTIAESNYTWTAGNLTQVDVTGTLLANGTRVTYEYDLSKTAKEFVAFHPNPEILLFQNAINYGNTNANVPVKSTRQDLDGSGNPTGTPVVAEFKNYVFDANGYITSFESSGGESVYGENVKNVLSYQCK